MAQHPHPYRPEDADDRWSGRGRRAKLGGATYDEDDDQTYAYGSSQNRWSDDEARYITGDDERDDAPEHSSFEEQREEGPLKAERNRNRVGESNEPARRNKYPPSQNGAYDDERYFSGNGKRVDRDENILSRDDDNNYGRGRQLHRDDTTGTMRGSSGGGYRRGSSNDDDNDAQMGGSKVKP